MTILSRGCRRLHIATILILLLALLLTTTSLVASEGVTFTTSDGITISGTIYGKGESAVILTHMYPTDQTSWKGFAEELAGMGFMALTFDFRGYGRSGGAKVISQIDRDLEAAVGLVKKRGAGRIYLIGASMGGTAALRVAAKEKVDGVVALSAPGEFSGLDALEAVARVSAPKLFIAAKDDPPALSGAQALYQRARPPKDLLLLPRGGHGTFIFNSGQGAALKQALLKFLTSR